jgi:hypothetical protein
MAPSTKAETKGLLPHSNRYWSVRPEN